MVIRDVGVHVEQMHPTLRHTYDGIVPWIQGLFSASCIHCNETFAQTSLQLCLDCHQEIPHTLKSVSLKSEILHECWSLGCYRGPLGSVIRKGKYASRRHLFETLGEYLAGACLELPSVDAVVSVPLPWRRLWTRGFNQSNVLSLEVARMLNVPHFELLQRIDPKEQASRMIQDRSIQITGRFGLHPRVDKDGIPESILLVDDVVTSGATFEGCAIELLNIGVSRVFGLAVANSR